MKFYGEYVMPKAKGLWDIKITNKYNPERLIEINKLNIVCKQSLLKTVLAPGPTNYQTGDAVLSNISTRYAALSSSTAVSFDPAFVPDIFHYENIGTESQTQSTEQQHREDSSQIGEKTATITGFLFPNGAPIGMQDQIINSIALFDTQTNIASIPPLAWLLLDTPIVLEAGDVINLEIKITRPFLSRGTTPNLTAVSQNFLPITSPLVIKEYALGEDVDDPNAGTVVTNTEVNIGLNEQMSVSIIRRPPSVVQNAQAFYLTSLNLNTSTTRFDIEYANTWVEVDESDISITYHGTFKTLPRAVGSSNQNIRFIYIPFNDSTGAGTQLRAPSKTGIYLVAQDNDNLITWKGGQALYFDIAIKLKYEEPTV